MTIRVDEVGALAAVVVDVRITARRVIADTHDPLFIDAANADLRLQATSPAIDAGRNESLQDNNIELDREGKDRFFDVVTVTDLGVGTAPIVDKGAYERDAGISPCNEADLASPFGVLDLSDITTFAAAFSAQDPIADINEDSVFDLEDITAFNKAFLLGCP